MFGTRSQQLKRSREAETEADSAPASASSPKRPKIEPGTQHDLIPPAHNDDGAGSGTFNKIQNQPAQDGNAEQPDLHNPLAALKTKLDAFARQRTEAMLIFRAACDEQTEAERCAARLRTEDAGAVAFMQHWVRLCANLLSYGDESYIGESNPVSDVAKIVCGADEPRQASKVALIQGLHGIVAGHEAVCAIANRVITIDTQYLITTSAFAREAQNQVPSLEEGTDLDKHLQDVDLLREELCRELRELRGRRWECRRLSDRVLAEIAERRASY
ncbi:hypothetical protein FDECE_6318 [Fusarium decemcellulare]|nr:hypothetical protein FDECE_6318 [Fusarium decemcellulare]